MASPKRGLGKGLDSMIPKKIITSESKEIVEKKKKMFHVKH